MTYHFARLLTSLAARMNRRAAALQTRLAARLQATAASLITKSNQAHARAAEARAVAQRISSTNLF